MPRRRDGRLPVKVVLGMRLWNEGVATLRVHRGFDPPSYKREVGKARRRLKDAAKLIGCHVDITEDVVHDDEGAWLAITARPEWAPDPKVERRYQQATMGTKEDQDGSDGD